MQKPLFLLALIEIVYLATSFYLAMVYGQWSYQGEILRSGLRIVSIIILILVYRRYFLTARANEFSAAPLKEPAFIMAVFALLTFAVSFTNAGHESGTWQAAFFVSGLLAGIREELFYRGVVQSWLQRKYPYRKALLFSTLIFTGAHIQYFYYQQYFPILLIFLAGIIFGCVFIYTGNVWMTVAVHAMYDAILSVSLLPVRLTNLAGFMVLLTLAGAFLFLIKPQLKKKSADSADAA